MDKLIGGWEIHAVGSYVFMAVFWSLIVRLIAVALRTIDVKPHCEEFRRRFFSNFLGCNPNDKNVCEEERESDYWIPFILGTIELLAYPIVMRVGAWNVIGAWIGFKTVAQWKRWAESRSPFNRYLINNALVVILSLRFLVHFVHLRPS